MTGQNYFHGTLRRFAVVKLWPDLKAAEDECIARIKSAAKELELECIEISATGEYLDDTSQSANVDSVDFVLHLHFETPKLYDAYSIVALWNPVEFYHEWGYYRTSRNLTTHDDFLSCDSSAADHQVARMVRASGTHLAPALKLYHSLSGVVSPPSLGDFHLFYVGINWEALGGGQSRHQGVLKRLDKTGLLRIYGPAMFQGVRVWGGYKSYIKEIPFDGSSLLEEISKCGISLVFSSPAHKESQLMSSRLFESIAAGALVICDENPWARSRFGSSLLYVDLRQDLEAVVDAILLHVNWAKANPGAAKAKIEAAQALLASKYNLVRNISDIYEGLRARQGQLESLQRPQGSALSVRAYFLMPDCSDRVLSQHMLSIKCQSYANFHPVLVTDEELSSAQLETISNVCGGRIEHLPTTFRVLSGLGGARPIRKLGGVILDLIRKTNGFDSIVFIAPNERLFSNHIAVLAGALQRDSSVACVATAAILKNGTAPIRGISELLDFGHFDTANPPGYGRFAFRFEGLPSELDIVLPYLDSRPLAALVYGRRIGQQLPASVVIDTTIAFPSSPPQNAHETEVLRGYNPEALAMYHGFRPRPTQQEAPPLPQQADLLPIPPSKMTLFSVIKFAVKNPRWIVLQVRLLFREGVTHRLRVFGRVVRL